jgi:hypothetical protein
VSGSPANTALTSVSEITEKIVAFAPPAVTDVAPQKPRPFTTTEKPPCAGPVFGVTEFTAGAALLPPVQELPPLAELGTVGVDSFFC